MSGGYTRELVETLLPAVWDEGYAYGIQQELAPDPDMPTASADKSHGCTLYAHLADIRQAWREVQDLIPLVERQALFVWYAIDASDDEIAKHGRVTGRAVRYRLERGIGRLTAHLNDDRYIEGYDGLDEAVAA